MSHFPKAVLYYSPVSPWSKTVLLTIEEKGYGDDEIQLKIVDILKAENLSMSFLRINPKGTVPSLVVPLENTLGPEDEHRFKALVDTKTIVEFLDKSRSSISRTHTVSSAPAPALMPATIALSATATTIIDLLHTDDVDPTLLLYYNPTTLVSLREAVPSLTPILEARLSAIEGYIDANEKADISASERTRKLWSEKRLGVLKFLEVYRNARKDDVELSEGEKDARGRFFATAKDFWHISLRVVLLSVDKEIVGPLTLGDQLSVADLHLAPWLAHIAQLCGAHLSDDGDLTVAKIEARLGEGFTFPKDFQQVTISSGVNGAASSVITPGAKRAKLAAFWDEMRGRNSWKSVFGSIQ